MRAASRSAGVREGPAQQQTRARVQDYVVQEHRFVFDRQVLGNLEGENVAD